MHSPLVVPVSGYSTLSRLLSETSRSPTRTTVDAAAGAASAAPAGWRLRASFAACTDASSAAIRSTTFGASRSTAGNSNSSPPAFLSISASTCSRYSSRYFSGSNGAVSDSTSASAIDTSLAETSTSPSTSSSSMFDGSTTSSANTIVLISNLPSWARSAATYCLLRITKRPMATLPASSIALASRTYGLGVLSGATMYGESKYTGSISSSSTNSSRSMLLVAEGMNGSSSSGSTCT